MKKCSQCGERLYKGTNFCPKCGTKVGFNSKKNILVAVILFLIIFTLVFFFCMLKIDKSNYASLINNNWNLNLPYIDEEYYYVDDNSNSPLGDGDRYSILKYTDSDKIEELNKFEWSTTLENNDKNMIDSALKFLKVPNDKKIDYNKNLLYMSITKDRSDKLVIAYDRDNETLYVFERYI